jgi:hypothetical protein
VINLILWNGIYRQLCSSIFRYRLDMHEHRKMGTKTGGKITAASQRELLDDLTFAVAASAEILSWSTKLQACQLQERKNSTSNCETAELNALCSSTSVRVLLQDCKNSNPKRTKRLFPVHNLNQRVPESPASMAI